MPIWNWRGAGCEDDPLGARVPLGVPRGTIARVGYCRGRGKRGRGCGRGTTREMKIGVPDHLVYVQLDEEAEAKVAQTARVGRSKYCRRQAWIVPAAANLWTYSRPTGGKGQLQDPASSGVDQSHLPPPAIRHSQNVGNAALIMSLPIALQQSLTSAQLERTVHGCRVHQGPSSPSVLSVLDRLEP
ncbi:hypothetical protein LIA77_10311 [Sarocladium implicatum]|nr:hypothetical protein LIA77_10311 [Sarocladium implicatum]